MKIKTEYQKHWENQRKHYKENYWIEDGKEEVVLKTLYPKWIAFLCHEFDEILSPIETFRGETEEEARGELIKWLKNLREKIDKIVGEC